MDPRGAEGEVMANSVGQQRNWREQYDRMKRWQARLHETNVADERRRDEFYAFFVTCFHLKDWLRGDKAVSKSAGTKAEKLMNKPSMRVCADIANGVKHLIRTNKKSVRFDADTQLEIAEGAFDESTFGADAFQVGEIKIAAMKQTWPALTIADHCVKYWEDFLRGEALLPS